MPKKYRFEKWIMINFHFSYYIIIFIIPLKIHRKNVKILLTKNENYFWSVKYIRIKNRKPSRKQQIKMTFKLLSVKECHKSIRTNV